jgi:hypothetical protein
VPKLSRQLPTPNKTEKFYVVPSTRSTLVLQLQTTVQGVFLVGGSNAAVVIHGRQIVQQVFCDLFSGRSGRTVLFRLFYFEGMSYHFIKYAFQEG